MMWLCCLNLKRLHNKLVMKGSTNSHTTVSVGFTSHSIIILLKNVN